MNFAVFGVAAMVGLAAGYAWHRGAPPALEATLGSPKVERPFPGGVAEPYSTQMANIADAQEQRWQLLVFWGTLVRPVMIGLIAFAAVAIAGSWIVILMPAL